MSPIVSQYSHHAYNRLEPVTVEDWLKPVILQWFWNQWFWTVMLLLQYHGHVKLIKVIRAINPCCLNYKSILLLLRRLKIKVWLNQIAKIQNLRNLKEIHCLASEKLTSKMEKNMEWIHVTFCYCKGFETNFPRNGHIALPLLSLLVARRQNLSGLKT